MKFVFAFFCLALAIPLSAKTAKVKKSSIKARQPAKTQTKLRGKTDGFALPPAVYTTGSSSLKQPAKLHKAPPEKPVLKSPPPGYEEAKFVLPQGPYGSFPGRIRPNTAPAWQPRGKVFLPRGSTNVALHKPVTSSDDFPIIGTVSGVTDGEKGFPEGYWVEIGPGTQWVQIDLQAKFKIHGVLLWHYFGAPNRVYHDVVIRLADDAEFTQNVRTVYNNDGDNTSGLGAGKAREFYEHNTGQWISFDAQSGRYVRLYSRGNTSDPLNHYIEVEVWGQPTK